MQNEELVKNIHRLGLENPPDELGNDFTIVKGDYQYYHYLCDQYDDRGWGCGYRTLQELVKRTCFCQFGLKQFRDGYKVVYLGNMKCLKKHVNEVFLYLLAQNLWGTS